MEKKILGPDTHSFLNYYLRAAGLALVNPVESPTKEMNYLLKYYGGDMEQCSYDVIVCLPSHFYSSLVLTCTRPPPPLDGGQRLSSIYIKCIRFLFHLARYRGGSEREGGGRTQGFPSPRNQQALTMVVIGRHLT